MSSTSSSDGSYTLTITFDVGTDLNTSLALVQNLVNSALAQLPGGVQQQGVTVRKVSPNILLVVSLYSEDDRFDEVFLSNYGVINLQIPTGPAPRCRPGEGLWCRSLQHAGLVGPRQAPDFRPHDNRCPDCHPGPECPGRCGTTRCSARAQRSALPVHDQRSGPSVRCEPVRRHHRQDRNWPGPADRAPARYRPGGFEPAELQQFCQYDRLQVGPDRDFRPARRQCHRCRRRCLSGHGAR